MLRTPLVIGTLLAVSVLGIARLVLIPDTWPSSLAALAFLPLAIGVLAVRSRSADASVEARKLAGRLRAALVGAGVLLATSLLLSIDERLGLSGRGGDGFAGSVIVVLPAIVAAAADLLSSRLESKAMKERD